MNIRIFIILLLILLAILDLFVFNNGTIKKADAAGDKDPTPSVQLDEDHIKVIFQLFYLDGEIEEETVIKNRVDMDKIWNQYKNWNLIEVNNDYMIFQKEVNDLSPLLKANGYFGLTDHKSFPLLHGQPKDHVIHLFYQFDLGKLEVCGKSKNRFVNNCF